MVDGQHHHVSARYLYQYAAEAAWKEDNRRLPNGEAFRRNHRGDGRRLRRPDLQDRDAAGREQPRQLPDDGATGAWGQARTDANCSTCFAQAN